jgi:hypothetical protein
MTSAEALEAVRKAADKAEIAQERARAAIAARDRAIVDAFEAGSLPPTIARTTNLSRSMVRKVLVKAGLLDADKTEQEA